MEWWTDEKPLFHTATEAVTAMFLCETFLHRPLQAMHVLSDMLRECRLRKVCRQISSPLRWRRCQPVLCRQRLRGHCVQQHRAVASVAYQPVTHHTR